MDTMTGQMASEARPAVERARRVLSGRSTPGRRTWFSVEDVARRLETGEAFVRGMCELGALRGARKAADGWRIPASALGLWLGDRLPRAFSFLTVSRLLDVSPRTIKRRVQSGALRAVHVPGIGPRVPESELLRLLAAPPFSFSTMRGPAA